MHSPLISLIVAIAKNNAIGKNNQLLWKLSDDLKLFKQLTTGHTIIMGRKTFDSIKRPLPNRKNIVVSRNKNLQLDGVTVVGNLAEAIEQCKSEEEVFVIGGAQLYKLAMHMADKLYMTVVNAHFDDADVFFPEIDMSAWKITEQKHFDKSEKNEFDFDFFVMKKIATK